MNQADTKSIQTIQADVDKSNFADARQAAEKLEARHTLDNCNMEITDLIDALANQDADGTKKAIRQFNKWWTLDAKNM